MTEQTEMDWDQDKEDINVEDLKDTIKAYYNARAHHDEMSKVAKEAYAPVAKYESEVISMLERSKLNNFELPDVCKVHMVAKTSVTVPKTPEDKAALFKWLKDELGADGFLAYATVNAQTLNKLFKDMLELTEDPTFRLPGVGDPRSYSTLRMNTI